MVEQKDKKNDSNRRHGFARRMYAYAQHIPERRNGGDRRNHERNDSQVKEQPAQSESAKESLPLSPEAGVDHHTQGTNKP